MPSEGRPSLLAFLRESVEAMDDLIEAILNRFGWTAR